MVEERQKQVGHFPETAIDPAHADADADADAGCGYHRVHRDADGLSADFLRGGAPFVRPQTFHV